MLSSLTEKSLIPNEVFQTKEGYFVVALVAVDPADPNRFPGVKKELERRLVYQRQEEFFQSWLTRLRENAKIEINQEVLRS